MEPGVETAPCFCFSKNQSDNTDKNVAKVYVESEKKTRVKYKVETWKKKHWKGCGDPTSLNPFICGGTICRKFLRKRKVFFCYTNSNISRKKDRFDKFIHLVINLDAEICLTLDILFGFPFVCSLIRLHVIFANFLRIHTKYVLCISFVLICSLFCSMVIGDVFGLFLCLFVKSFHCFNYNGAELLAGVLTSNG